MGNIFGGVLLNDELIQSINNDFQITPVGTIEFIKAWIEQVYNIESDEVLRPLNVPKCFIDKSCSGRTVKNVSSKKEIEEFLKDKEEIFVKSNKIIKSSYNGIVTKDSVDKLKDNYEYQISEKVNIISEYRVFVYKNEIRGIQYYSGDFKVFPNIRSIEFFIENYKDSPEAYTLDVYIKDDGETYVMEAHEFYSCGLYGFSDYEVLPYMLHRTWNNIKKRIHEKLNIVKEIHN